MGNRSALHVFRIGVFAIIELDNQFLLARRRDIGWWNLPGGGVEPGETVDDAVRREVREEVGIEFEIYYLVGVYSKPQKNEVVLTFWGHPCKGEIVTTDESSEVGWFKADRLPTPFLPKHRQRLLDAIIVAESFASTSNEDEDAVKSMHVVIRSQRTSSEEDQEE